MEREEGEKNVRSLVELITNSLPFFPLQVKTNTRGRTHVEHKVLILLLAQKAV